MQVNIGSRDKTIRLSIAAIIAILFFLNWISGFLAMLLLGIAIFLSLTSLLKFCPLYTLIGLNTCKSKKSK